MATVWSEKIANLRKAHGASPVKPSDTAARQTDESVLGSEKLANAEVALGGSIGMALLRRRRSQEALELMQQMATSPAQQEPVASPAVAKEQPTPAVAPRSVEPTPEVLTTASAVVAAKEELAAADKFSEWCIRVDYSLPFAQPPVTTPMADGENDGAVTSAPAEVAESAAVPMLPHRPVAFKGECIQTLMECHGSDAPINCIAVLPGGLLATGSDEAPVRVWDPTTGAECSQLGGFSGAVYSLAAHGPILAGGSDSAVLLWTIESWQFLRRLEGHSSYVWCLGMYMVRSASARPQCLLKMRHDMPPQNIPCIFYPRELLGLPSRCILNLFLLLFHYRQRISRQVATMAQLISSPARPTSPCVYGRSNQLALRLTGPMLTIQSMCLRGTAIQYIQFRDFQHGERLRPAQRTPPSSYGLRLGKSMFTHESGPLPTAWTRII